MPTKGYFMQMTGAVLLGLAALAVAAILVFTLSPYILPFFSAMLPFLLGAFLVIVAVIVVWLILYAAAMIGVAIYYAIRHPMEVSKEHGAYALDKVKESGKREKGDSKGKEEKKEGDG